MNFSRVVDRCASVWCEVEYRAKSLDRPTIVAFPRHNCTLTAVLLLSSRVPTYATERDKAAMMATIVGSPRPYLHKLVPANHIIRGLWVGSDVHAGAFRNSGDCHTMTIRGP